MAWIAVAIGGAAVVGAVASNSAAKTQSKAALRAAELSNDAQERMFERSRADMEPWRQTGQGALFSLADLMGIKQEGQTPTNEFGALRQPFDYNAWKDPGYDFRFGEGVKALDRSAAARGNLFSGATGKALTEYGQNFGANEFMNAYNRWNQNQDTLYNRLAGLSGTGQSSAQQIGAWGMNTGQNIAANTTAGMNNAAAARASGYMGVANAAGAGLNAFAQYQGGKGFQNYGAPAPVPYNNGQPYYNPAGW